MDREMIRFPAAVQTVKRAGKVDDKRRNRRFLLGFYLVRYSLCASSFWKFFLFYTGTAWNGTVYGEEITSSGLVGKKKWGSIL